MFQFLLGTALGTQLGLKLSAYMLAKQLSP